MNRDVADFVCSATGAERVLKVDLVQSLWSGYGQIARVQLGGSPMRSAIVKQVSPPDQTNHPRGWNSDQSHRRKLRSYEVELAWYQDFSERCGSDCRVPKCYATRSINGQSLFVLEDLDAAGFPRRQSSLRRNGVETGLRYLANFHATFLGQPPKGLWPIGTYWNLATRPDEWQAMRPGELKTHAAAIDTILNQCRYKTIVHGDAKVANFCFSEDLQQIAAVDFQYVGGGCGMKDVAYFFGSCLDESECQQGESTFLETYFSEFRKALKRTGSTESAGNIEREWRELYPVAWADFTRFMLGWCPEHGKLNAYSRRLSRSVTKELESKR